MATECGSHFVKPMDMPPVEVTGMSSEMLQRLVHVLVARPKVFVFVEVGENTKQMQLHEATATLQDNMRAMAARDSQARTSAQPAWRPAVRPRGEQRVAQGITKNKQESDQKCISISKGKEQPVEQSSPSQGNGQARAGDRPSSDCFDWQEVNKKGQHRAKSKWDLADEIRACNAKAWEKEQALSRKRQEQRAAALRIQTSARAWLAKRRVAQIKAQQVQADSVEAKNIAQQPEKVVHGNKRHIKGKRGKEKSDDQRVLDEAVAQAQKERALLLAEAGRLKQLHQRVAGSNSSPPGWQSAFRCSQCEVDYTEEICFPFGKEDGSEVWWCTTCFKLDIEICLKHPTMRQKREERRASYLERMDAEKEERGKGNGLMQGAHCQVPSEEEADPLRPKKAVDGG